MVALRTPSHQLDPPERAFYRRAVATLERDGVPFLIGGAFALAHYTGIVRHTKDFDVFLKPADVRRALDALAAAGYAAELTYPHWLAKVRHGDLFVDVIFCSGNGVAAVDDGWFEHASPGRVLGRAVRFCPPEEMIWSKAFVMERERYDGADIAHLLRACADGLDWPRLLRRFDRHWHVLLSHLVLFRFAYPGEAARVPDAVMGELVGRLQGGAGVPAPERLCRGTLLSAGQYLIDVERWGLRDARLKPWGNLEAGDLDWWRRAIREKP
jgi:hypothetical protein